MPPTRPRTTGGCSSPNNGWMSPAAASIFSSRSPRPARSTASASCRPSSVCRGRRQRPPLPEHHIQAARRDRLAGARRRPPARAGPGSVARPIRRPCAQALAGHGVRRLPLAWRAARARPAGSAASPPERTAGRQRRTCPDVQPRRDRAAGLAVERPQHRPRPVRLATRCRAAQGLQLGATRLRPTPTRPTAPFPSMPRSDVAPCAFISRAALADLPCLASRFRHANGSSSRRRANAPLVDCGDGGKPRGRARTAPR